MGAQSCALVEQLLALAADGGQRCFGRGERVRGRLPLHFSGGKLGIAALRISSSLRKGPVDVALSRREPRVASRERLRRFPHGLPHILALLRARVPLLSQAGDLRCCAAERPAAVQLVRQQLHAAAHGEALLFQLQEQCGLAVLEPAPRRLRLGLRPAAVHARCRRLFLEESYILLQGRHLSLKLRHGRLPISKLREGRPRLARRRPHPLLHLLRELLVLRDQARPFCFPLFAAGLHLRSQTGRHLPLFGQGLANRATALLRRPQRETKSDRFGGETLRLGSENVHDEAAVQRCGGAYHLLHRRRRASARVSRWSGVRAAAGSCRGGGAVEAVGGKLQCPRFFSGASGSAGQPPPKHSPPQIQVQVQVRTRGCLSPPPATFRKFATTPDISQRPIRQ